MGEGSDSTASSISIESNVGDFVIALHDRKLYIKNFHDLGEDEAFIYSLSYSGIAHRRFKFKAPQAQGDVWVSLNDILCIIPEFISTQRSFEICPDAHGNVIKLTSSNISKFILSIFFLIFPQFFLILMLQHTLPLSLKASFSLKHKFFKLGHIVLTSYQKKNLSLKWLIQTNK